MSCYMRLKTKCLGRHVGVGSEAQVKNVGFYMITSVFLQIT